MEYRQDNEMVTLYVSECEKLLSSFDKIVIDTLSKGEFSDQNELYRIVHTLKGSSAMMELTSLVELSHRFESILSNTGLITDIHSLVDLMLAYSKYSRYTLSAIQSREPLKPGSELLGILTELETNTKNEVKTEKIKKSNSISSETVRIKVLLNKCPLPHIRASVIARVIKASCPSLKTEPDNIDRQCGIDDEILKNGFEIHLEPSDKENIDEIIRTILAQPYVSACEQINRSNASENFIDGSGIVTTTQVAINTLMHYAEELSSEESMLEEIIRRSGLQQKRVYDLLSLMRQNIRSINQLSSEIGMHSLNGVFMQMLITARGLAKALGKEINFELSGEDTEVDKSILDILSDSLIHIIRNAADHGIEMPEVRKRLGKKETGTIKLSACKKNDYLTVTISDDGQGIDYDRLLISADSKGILVKPRAQYKGNELVNLMFMSGVSTKSDVTKYSGRGVGLDTVARRIRQVGGSISVDTVKDSGTTFTLKIPLSITIIDGMEITLYNDTHIIVPISSVLHIAATDNDYSQKMYNELEYTKLYFPGETQCNSAGYSLYLTSDYGRQYIYAKQISPINIYYVKSLPQCVFDRLGKRNIFTGCSLCSDARLLCILDVQKLITISDDYEVML